jgi:hypothetical protein
MQKPQYSDNEFLSQSQFNATANLVENSLTDIGTALHTPGLVAASNLSFTYSGLNITVTAPLPFRALFSDGTLASANGTTDGSTIDNATVDFSALVPASGSITAYLVATKSTVQQNAFQVIGPPPGHPDYNPNFAPYTAYSEVQDTLVFTATATAPNNTDTLFIASTVLTAGQTAITASSVTGQQRAGAVLSQDGEVVASDLASGAAASNVGALGGSLSGTLPNPSIAATGVTAAQYTSPLSITVGADGRVTAATNNNNETIKGTLTVEGTSTLSTTTVPTATTATNPLQLQQLQNNTLAASLTGLKVSGTSTLSTTTVPAATAGNNPVALSQVANAAPIGAQANSTTATSVTATTGTFTAPCDGWLTVFGYGQNQSGDIGGTGLSSSLGGLVNMAAAESTSLGRYETAYLIMTAGQQTTLSFNATTTVAGALDAFVSAFFIPNP